MPDATGPKSGRPVINVLFQKYPAPIVPAAEGLEHYGNVLEFAPLDITEDTIETISGTLL